jgi:hypothetical protein
MGYFNEMNNKQTPWINCAIRHFLRLRMALIICRVLSYGLYGRVVRRESNISWDTSLLSSGPKSKLARIQQKQPVGWVSTRKTEVSSLLNTCTAVRYIFRPFSVSLLAVCQHHRIPRSGILGIYTYMSHMPHRDLAISGGVALLLPSVSCSGNHAFDFGTSMGLLYYSRHSLPCPFGFIIHNHSLIPCVQKASLKLIENIILYASKVIDGIVHRERVMYTVWQQSSWTDATTVILLIPSTGNKDK